MARHRSRSSHRSPVEPVSNRSFAKFLLLLVLLAVATSVFQAAPGLGLFLFAVLPITVGNGVL